MVGYKFIDQLRLIVKLYEFSSGVDHLGIVLRIRGIPGEFQEGSLLIEVHLFLWEYLLQIVYITLCKFC